VLLTEHGRGLYEAAAERQRPWATALVRGLLIEDIEAATALLRTVRGRLDAASASGGHDEP
jgi:hypothetical protein